MNPYFINSAGVAAVLMALAASASAETDTLKDQGVGDGHDGRS